jgi:hypothetical protein
VRGALPRRVLVRCTSADVSCACLQDEVADAAVVVGDAASAAEPAAAGPSAATPPPGNSLPKDPTKWSVDQVQEWFAAHKLGKWRKHALQFADVDGEELCEMEKEDFLRRVPCNGDIIFNDIAKLKKQVSSSSSESSPGSAAGTAAALNAPTFPLLWLRAVLTPRASPSAVTVCGRTLSVLTTFYSVSS